MCAQQALWCLTAKRLLNLRPVGHCDASDGAFEGDDGDVDGDGDEEDNGDDEKVPQKYSACGTWPRFFS